MFDGRSGGRPKQIAKRSSWRRTTDDGSSWCPQGMGTISRERNWRILLAVCLDRLAIDFSASSDAADAADLASFASMSQRAVENGSHETSAPPLCKSRRRIRLPPSATPLVRIRYRAHLGRRRLVDYVKSASTWAIAVAHEYVACFAGSPID
uniref:Uncharacterized protein n=1 Tax=Plectus sambesii TaxID=2011161 RepID=A0A914UVR7_9BILA